MRVRTASATVSLVLVALTAAACSSSSGGSNGSTGPASVASTGTGPSKSTAAAPTTVDVCGDLPLATASQITGMTYTGTKADSVEGQVFSCNYSNAQAELQVTVIVQAAKADYDGDVNVLATVGHAPNKIAGVGDAAFSMPDPNGNAGSVGASSFASYGALFGSVYIKIGGVYVTPDQGKQLVEALQSKL